MLLTIGNMSSIDDDLVGGVDNSVGENGELLRAAKGKKHITHRPLNTPSLRRITVYRGVLILWGWWNREVPLYTEVSSFQGVGIEGFHSIQRCLDFMELVE